MPALKTFLEHRDTIKNGDSIFFPPPVNVKGGSTLFLGKKQIVMAQVRNGMLCFADHDKYFKKGPRMLPLDNIREDQQVVVSV
jgi:hypothetical protein